MDAAFIPQNYLQTEPFTCGATSLITALRFLGRLSVPPTRTLELSFWRRANTIYMGEGIAGCGPYGLGCIALDYGCAAALFASREKGFFNEWNERAGRGDAPGIIEELDRARFLSLGGHIHPEAALPFAGSGARHAILALEGGGDIDKAHWACFTEDGDGLYLRHDPEEEGEPAPYGLGDIRAGAHYRGQRAFLWLSA
jgi:hypothetical protein